MSHLRHWRVTDDPYGRHLREVVKAVRALPLTEHRSACKCKRCRKAQANAA
jgi:alkyl hydroperoxide reductase subunit AhpC